MLWRSGRWIDRRRRRQEWKYVRYTISHNLERLHVKLDRCCSLSTFSSSSLKELNLTMKSEFRKIMTSDCVKLPNLTTLDLNHNNFKKIPKFEESFFVSVPALTTLRLELPEIFLLAYLNYTLPRIVHFAWTGVGFSCFINFTID